MKRRKIRTMKKITAEDLLALGDDDLPIEELSRRYRELSARAPMVDYTTEEDVFDMYQSWWPDIEKLTDEQAGQLIKTIYIFEQGNKDAKPADASLIRIYNNIKDTLLEDAEKNQ